MGGLQALVGFPRARDLDREELRRLANDIANEEDAWKPHVRHDLHERHYVQLHHDAHVDVWLICWSNQQETGLHDHDLSSGAVRVCSGDLLEERLEERDGVLSRVAVERRSGTTFDFDASHVHCIRHRAGRPPAVSIHVYSPALGRMGYYEIGDDGLLRRCAVDHAAEFAA